MEIVRIFHSGYFDCRGAFQTVLNVACQFNSVSRSYPVVSGLPPSTDGGCFGRCAGFHGFSY